MIVLRFGSLLTMSNKIIYDTNYDVKIAFFRKPLGSGAIYRYRPKIKRIELE
jgi:hypothetical protein